MSFDVKGKIALITGSTKGIGRAIAEALAENGASVVIVSRHQNDCDAVAAGISKKYGAETLAVAADITKQEQIDQLVAKAVARFGRIDVLVNNAGSAITKKAEDLTEADWDRVVNLDLRAVFFTAQAVGRQMIAQKSGKIINISSILGLVADKQVLPYCVSKGGVLQMTKALALEWAKHNIQVNAICPGYVITEINRDFLTDEKASAGLLRKTVMRRFGQVEEIAGAAVFLASGASSYMTGQQIVIDGGWTAE
ncbi:SDR family NAD(P)-dependent oxidoreductase [Papillibacter cinnamivorans]|uniref:Gluconate 5-dehydrogenase n=1 Tax=Papillibacter cinnamivorans DSM 12816 TaxID=1122930 RepID=A0A1W1YP21_9FIRM|nr:glucose 1-dehydrogenase [Papillibacter cinnamivorans]SMC37935.1 gluconate 5-dehydrogenase [Papillibacter cinnamivorans DSM 12816]